MPACVLRCSVIWLFVTPWAVTCQAPLSTGFFKQEYWSELPFPPPGYLPDPRIKPMSPASPPLAGGFFTTEPPGKPLSTHTHTHTHIFRFFSVFTSVQLLSRVWLCVTRWTAARQASLSVTNSRSLLKLMSIESVMPSNHLILCHPLLPAPSFFPSIRVFSNELLLCIR